MLDSGKAATVTMELVWIMEAFGLERENEKTCSELHGQGGWRFPSYFQVIDKLLVTTCIIY